MCACSHKNSFVNNENYLDVHRFKQISPNKKKKLRSLFRYDSQTHLDRKLFGYPVLGIKLFIIKGMYIHIIKHHALNSITYALWFWADYLISI